MIILKRGMSAVSGAPLLYGESTALPFGDAKESVAKVTGEVQDL